MITDLFTLEGGLMKLTACALLLVVSITAQAFASPGEGTSSTETEKPLTNADIVALVRAGLSDDVLIAKIRQTKARAIDLSTEALIQLKDAGVSSAVIAELLRAEVSTPPAPSRLGNTNAAFDARAPLDAVIDDNTMLVEATDGAKRVKMTQGQFNRVGVMGAGATYMIYPGARSSVRTTDRRPTLTFVHETSPLEYVFMVKLDSDLPDNDRSLKIGSFFKRGGGFTSKNNGKPDPDWVLPYEMSEQPSNVWHVRPKTDLPLGEYALYFQSVIWAFGVD